MVVAWLAFEIGSVIALVLVFWPSSENRSVAHLEESYCPRKWRAVIVNIKSYQSGWFLLSSHDVTAVHLKTSIKMNNYHSWVCTFLCCNYLGGIKANRTFQKKVRK